MTAPSSPSSRPPVDLVIDGHRAHLVEMSSERAVVHSSMQLKPDQRVRVALRIDGNVLRTHAKVASAKFEMPKEGARYRVELLFEDAAAIAQVYPDLRQG